MHGRVSLRLNNLQLANDLCAVSTTLRELRRIHVKAYGALIPHVFMASVLAHVGRCLFEGIGGDPERECSEIASILQALEAAMADGDRETRNVVAISFVRDAELEPFFTQLRPLLGPKMRLQAGGR